MIFRLRQRHHDNAAIMIKSQTTIATATPMIVWSLNIGSGIGDVIPSAALAAEPDVFERPATVVVLTAMRLVTTDGPEPELPAAELKRVEIGVEAELNKVDTGLDG